MKPTIQMVREALDFAECALSHERVCRDCAEGGCLTVDADGKHGCPDCTNDEAQARLRALAASLEGYVLIERENLRHLLDCCSPYPGSINEAATRTADELLTASEAGHD